MAGAETCVPTHVVPFAGTPCDCAIVANDCAKSAAFRSATFSGLEKVYRKSEVEMVILTAWLKKLNTATFSGEDPIFGGRAMDLTRGKWNWV
jgi:hypothetical protein